MTQTAAERPRTQLTSHLLTFLLAGCTALLLCYLVFLFVYAPENNDQSWLLYAAQQMLAGARLYGAQLVETNPPLIIWFSVLPVELARLLHLSSYLMLRVVVFIMVLGSVAWSGRILRRASWAESRTQFYAGCASILAAEVFVTGIALGQREHLLVILFMPYALCAITNARKNLRLAELCAIGFAGGIAVCFKPQDALILFALEVFLAVASRSLRRLLSPELLCAIGAVLAYIAMVRVFAPLYLSNTVPLLLETYWAIGVYSASYLLRTSYIFDFLFVLALAVLIHRRRQLRYPLAPAAFLGCSLGACIAYCAQHTFGENRFYPQEAFLLLAILWIAIDLTSAALARWKFSSAFSGCAVLVSLVLLPAAVSIGHSFQKLEVPNWRVPDTVFAQYPPHTPVFLFSTTIDAMRVVLNHHLIWASRFPYPWMLPAILRSELAEAGGPTPRRVLSPQLVRKLANLQRTETAEDFQRWKPPVVIVQQCHKFTPVHSPRCWFIEDLDFNPLAWFLQSPAFAAEWSHYQLSQRQGDYDVYTRTH